ncbi:hypothetical protein UY3_02476 [Chelonia mydas]|uniref:Uncharacterized protein n=1 Tax=Chelonia mydas TaxID=8469 RepID=M7C729_CHEMY|nr:hypothetical protein UY3_02476 [Chelonia mydas]
MAAIQLLGNGHVILLHCYQAWCGSQLREPISCQTYKNWADTSTLVVYSIIRFNQTSNKSVQFVWVVIWARAGIGNVWHVAHQGKPPGRPGRFVYQLRLQVRPIAASAGRGSPLQASGGFRKGVQHISQLELLPTAPIGLERRTAASGSRDRPNRRTRQECANYGIP